MIVTPRGIGSCEGLLRGPGAFALLALAALSIDAPSAQNATGQGRTVEYWVAAVPVTWNVVPNERSRTR